LHSLNGITKYLYLPNIVEKVVWHSSPSLIPMLW